MNPFVFFVGCPRSGTTLLKRIAEAHPELAVIHETRWIPRTYEFRRGLTADGLVLPKLIERMRDPRRLRRLELDADELERRFRGFVGLPFASFVTALFDDFGERHGKRLVGDKTPGYVRYLPLLHRLWPHARFVHIIRDGRDVCLSVLDWRKGATSFDTFDADPVSTVGIWWEWYVRLGLEGGRQLDPALYHELRYESIVADAEREVVRLCEFLAVPYDASMLRFHEGRTKSKPGLSSKSAWLPVTGGLRDWRTTMDADDLLRFEAGAGDLLEELGYRRTAFVPRSALERAARVRERFIEQALARRRPIPDAWSGSAVGQAAAARGGR